MAHLRSESSRIGRRRSLFWGWLTIVPIAVLFVLPGAGATGASALVKHVAPFHGTLHIASTVTSSGCGGSASLVVAPTFNFTTGVGRESIKSSAIGCGPPGFSDYGAAAATTGMDSAAVLMTSPAAHNFSFVARLNASYNLSASPQNPAGGSFAWASAAFVFNGLLWDITNSTLRAGLLATFIGFTTNGTTTGNASGFVAGPFAFKTFYPGNLTAAGHRYIFIFWAELLEWTYAPSGTSLHASARFNMATSGHNEKLLSWSLG